MFKAFFSVCILFMASVLFAVSPRPLSPQKQFDKLIERKEFGEKELMDLRAIMDVEKESGEKIDCTFCPDGLTWYLATNHFFNEASWLFDRKADFGIKDKDGMNILHAACRDGCLDFVKELIERGAEITLPDNDGRTAIHYACMSGNSKLVETLLKLGIDPNKMTKNKETPLHFAAKYSGLEEVTFLIEHGASIKAINWSIVEALIDQRRRQDKLYLDSDEKRVIALKNALGLKTPEALQYVEEEEEYGEGIDEEDNYGGERYADTDEDYDRPRKKKENVEIINDFDHIPVDLLPREVNDAANTDGMTALHFAAQKGDMEVVQYLIEHGADIKAQDSIFSRSVIHFAAENGNLETVKYLTEKGADLLDKDGYGATALHYAAKSNRLNVIKYLVDQKVDYTATDGRGWTAMHYAAAGGSIDVIKYLLAKNLNINALNETGRTPLFFAGKDRDLRRFMISNGAK